MDTPNLLDAIRVVKENERTASESYADSARKITNPLGKKLFEQLSEFETFHFEQITALEDSLAKSGKYIEYQGKEFPLPPHFDFTNVQEAGSRSAIAIIVAAMDLESQAEKAYIDLAIKITDPQGHEMFTRLANEENKHHRVLLEAYWNLNNLGNWQWTRP
jgi:rubrerythrin